MRHKDSSKSFGMAACFGSLFRKKKSSRSRKGKETSGRSKSIRETSKNPSLTRKKSEAALKKARDSENEVVQKSDGVAENSIAMTELREKIMRFRDLVDLPPCISSLTIVELVDDTVKELHKLHPDVVHCISVSDSKGAPMDKVLNELCVAIESLGNHWMRSDEWMVKSKKDDKANGDLEKHALALLDDMITVTRERLFNMMDTDDNGEMKEDGASHSDKVRFSSSPPTPTSVLSEFPNNKSTKMDPRVADRVEKSEDQTNNKEQAKRDSEVLEDDERRLGVDEGKSKDGSSDGLVRVHMDILVPPSSLKSIADAEKLELIPGAVSPSSSLGRPSISAELQSPPRPLLGSEASQSSSSPAPPSPEMGTNHTAAASATALGNVPPPPPPPLSEGKSETETPVPPPPPPGPPPLLSVDKSDTETSVPPSTPPPVDKSDTETPVPPPPPPPCLSVEKSDTETPVAPPPPTSMATSNTTSLSAQSPPPSAITSNRTTLSSPPPPPSTSSNIATPLPHSPAPPSPPPPVAPKAPPPPATASPRSIPPPPPTVSSNESVPAPPVEQGKKGAPPSPPQNAMPVAPGSPPPPPASASPGSLPPPPPPPPTDSSNGSVPPPPPTTGQQGNKGAPPPPPGNASVAPGLPPPPPAPAAQGSMPPPPIASSNGSTAAAPPPVQNGKRGAPPPPPAVGGSGKFLRKSVSKLKRSSQMGCLYRQLKSKVEGSSSKLKSSQKKCSKVGASGGNGNQGMADALAEITKRSSYFQQIEDDVKNYANSIKEVKAALVSFQTTDMDELIRFHKYVESHLEKLTDETQVLARFEDFPSKKLEGLRMAASLYSKLDMIATTLQNWKIVPPVNRLLDQVENYFNKIKGEIDTLDRTKDDEIKKFRCQKIHFDFIILIRIKELMVDVSSSCMELALKEKREGNAFKTNGKKTNTGKMLWRAFQFAFRVYSFAGGQDDRAENLTREIAQQIQTDM